MKIAVGMGLSRLSLCLLLGVGAACTCSAATFTASGSDTDGAVSAQAVITPGAGTVSIALSNLLTTENSIGQAISDISFSISGANGAVTYGTSSATVINIAHQSGDVTSSVASTSTTGFGWNLSKSGTTITLDALGGGQPTDLIVGSGPYGGGGFDPHNPSLQGSATFNLNVAGVTSSSTISNVMFSFGTGPELNLRGIPSTPAPVPEPTSILLLGTVFAITGKLLARRLSA